MIPALLAIALITQPPIVAETAARWDGHGVQVAAVAVNCGYENAFYFDSLGLVAVCNEMLEHGPDVARFVINHEMGHAWMAQNGIGDSERGADELALLMSTKKEALAAAAYFHGLGSGDDGDDGQHQSHQARGDEFVCLAYGLYDPMQTAVVCRMYAASVRENWMRMGFAR